MENKKRNAQNTLNKNGLVSEDVKAMVKEFARVRKAIKNALKSGEKTIPEIAAETDMRASDVTYSLMTMIKYGDVVAGDMDDDDEYYYYQLKQEK